MMFPLSFPHSFSHTVAARSSFSVLTFQVDNSWKVRNKEDKIKKEESIGGKGQNSDIHKKQSYSFSFSFVFVASITATLL